MRYLDTLAKFCMRFLDRLHIARGTAHTVHWRYRSDEVAESNLSRKCSVSIQREGMRKVSHHLNFM
jgi:hypothetical protein